MTYDHVIRDEDRKMFDRTTTHDSRQIKVAMRNVQDRRGKLISPLSVVPDSVQFPFRRITSSERSSGNASRYSPSRTTMSPMPRPEEPS